MKMKDVFQISLMVFVAVNFGQVTAIPDLQDAMDDCFMNNYSEETKCRDYDAVVACLEKIDPANDEEQEHLEDSIAGEKREKVACPDLNTMGTCIYAETSKCLQKTFDYFSNSSKEVCNEAKRSIDCLIKLNDTCNHHTIQSDVDELDGLLDECATGRYDDEVCFNVRAFDCISKVYINYDADMGNFACKPDEVAAAKTCLNKWLSKCTTKVHKDEMKQALTDVNQICPSEN